MASENVNNLKQEAQENEENPYECTFCFKRFSLPGILNQHTIRTHNKTYDIKCDICKKLFQTKHVLERHKSVHGNREAYPCESCDKAFPDKHQLSNHKSVHNEREFKCSFCSKGFKTIFIQILQSTLVVNNCFES